MGKKQQRNSNNNVKGAAAAPQKLKKGSSSAGTSNSATTTTSNNGSTSGNVVSIAFQIVFAIIRFILAALLSFPFWFLTHTLSLVYGRPPKLVYWSQAVRFLKYTWSSQPPPLLPLSERIRLTRTICVHTLVSRISGFCWLLDEILYGNKLNHNISVEKPLFVVSAYRSASTQMARCLAASEESHFVAPNSLQCAWPYLWLWYLVTWIVGELRDPNDPNQEEDNNGLSKDDIRGYLNKTMTPETLARHDNDPFQLDTFDGPFLSSHLNGLAWQLGPQVIVREFNYAQYIPENKHLFERNMVEYMDRIARKTMLFSNCINNNATMNNSTSDGDDRQHHHKTLLIKGHFLTSCPALEQKYPGAKFLTVLRDPVSRLQSGINYLAVNPSIWQGKPNWAWLAKAVTETEAMYCEKELQWFRNHGNDDENRLAVRFDAFVDPKGFPKTMKKIFTWLGKDKVPSDVVPPQRCHNSTSVRNHYKVNVTLQQLNVDEKAYTERLANYIAWMKQVDK